MAPRKLEIRGNLESDYADVFTSEAVAVLEALAGLDADRKVVMAARIARRAARARNKQRLTFLDPQANIGRTKIKVQDARDGNFVGSEIPKDLQRQWIQGTGPAAKPNASCRPQPPIGSAPSPKPRGKRRVSFRSSRSTRRLPT